MNLQKKHRKKIENEYDSQIDDYRDTNQDEEAQHVNGKLSKLPVHGKLQKLDLNNVMMDVDATTLYPSAMYDENSIYPKIESGLAFESYKKIIYVETLKTQTSNQDGNESPIKKILQST